MHSLYFISFRSSIFHSLLSTFSCKSSSFPFSRYFTDITYRVYDYDRLQDGKPRALHVQQSIDVIKAPFEPAVAEHEKLDVEGAEAEKLVSCPCYTVCKATVNGTAEFDWNQPFVDISVLDGEGSFDGTPVKKGTHLIVPACYGKMKAEGKNLMMIYSYITQK